MFFSKKIEIGISCYLPWKKKWKQIKKMSSADFVQIVQKLMCWNSDKSVAMSPKMKICMKAYIPILFLFFSRK